MSAHNGNGSGRRPVFDAIVVGGGHNGLTAAAYPARADLRVCVLEAREILGGACVTEELWPGQRVSRASYVVSTLQPKVVADLELTRFGYHPIPLDPEFATFGADGQPILLPNDEQVAYEQVARVSRRDADALASFNALFEKAALFLKPLMMRPPPAAGSKRPGDVFELLREAGRAARMSRRDLTDIFRLMTMSVGDLLDDHFETDELKGAYASSGAVGVWAGPYTPGTPTTSCTTCSARSAACRVRGATCAAAWARSPRRSRPARAPPGRRSAPARRSPRSTSATGASPG